MLNNDNTATATATLQELMKLHEPVTPVRGKLVRGTVVGISKHGAWVDFGSKADGLVPKASAEANDLKVGLEANFMIGSTGEDEDPTVSDDTTIILSGPDVADGWHRMQALAGTGQTVEVKLGRAIRRGKNCAGCKAYFGPLHGFIPYSLIGFKGTELDNHVGETLTVIVLEASAENGRKLVFDHKTCVRSVRDKERAELFDKLKVGDAVTGTVAQFVDYGVFVDIGGGLQGLLHRSEITSDREARLDTLLQRGQKLTVKVIRHQTTPDGKRQLGFSLKKAKQAAFIAQLQEGAIVTARVRQIVDFGIFAELSAEAKVDGLIHRSEFNNSMRHGRKTLEVGEPLRVRVLSVDKDLGRVRLSLRDVNQRVDEPVADAASEPCVAETAACSNCTGCANGSGQSDESNPIARELKAIEPFFADPGVKA